MPLKHVVSQDFVATMLANGVENGMKGCEIAFKQDRDFLDKASMSQEFITRSVAQLFPAGRV